MSLPLLRIRDCGRTWALYALLLCLLAGVCFGSLRHHLLDTHDLETFLDNQQIEQDWTFFFAADKAQPSGRPLAELVKYGAYRIWGNDPAAFHLLVVVFHVLASLLLAVVCRRLGGDLELAFPSGLLFLVNVAHFQAVHHISALDYPLALSCCLLSLHAYLEFLDTGARRAWVAFALYLLLGLLAHLGSFALVLFVLYLAWRGGVEPRRLVVQGLLMGVPLAGAGLVSLSLAAPETSVWMSIGVYQMQALWKLVAGMGRVLLWFVSRLLTTAHWVPLAIYARQEWELYLGAGLLVGLLVLSWKRVEPIWPWAGWLLLWLVPFLLLTEEKVLELPAGPSRYLYPASAGSSVLLAWGLRWGARRWGKAGRYLLPLVFLGVLISSYYSLSRVEAISLYTSGRCYIAGGIMDTGAQQLQRAIAQGKEVIPLEGTYFRLACVLPFVGEDPEPTLKEGLARFPDSIWLNSLLSAVEVDTDDQKVQARGRERFQQVLGIAQATGHAGDLLNNLAGFSFNQGKRYLLQDELQKAIQAFQRARELVPERDKYHRALSYTYNQVGIRLLEQERVAEAVAAFRQALEADPESAEARANLELFLPQGKGPSPAD